MSDETAAVWRIYALHNLCSLQHCSNGACMQDRSITCSCFVVRRSVVKAIRCNQPCLGLLCWYVSQRSIRRRSTRAQFVRLDVRESYQLLGSSLGSGRSCKQEAACANGVVEYNMKDLVRTTRGFVGSQSSGWLVPGLAVVVDDVMVEIVKRLPPCATFESSEGALVVPPCEGMVDDS